MSYDLIIQAGHEGRTKGATGAYANGIAEKSLTPIIANAATAEAEARGLSVLRIPADGLSTERAKLAIAIHLDGNPAAGAQVLYDDVTDRPAARDLLAAYVAHLWPFKTLPDNTTPLKGADGYSRYYGFKYWITTDAEMVIECGTLGNPDQAKWLKANAEVVGRFIGAWAHARISGEPLKLDTTEAEQIKELESKLKLAQQTIENQQTKVKQLQTELAAEKAKLQAVREIIR